MITVDRLLLREGISPGVRELLNLIPPGRRTGLLYLGSFHCEKGGKEAAILQGEGSFIVCRHNIATACVASPSVFAALEGVFACEHLWKVGGGDA